ncbi:DoxX family protein [Paenibacillus sp. JDR-2]|uniref:DoxX family protein n=1 Tax=Paenibacillus sp. (strain JDR-2) TaxID=324057 RepID=UPI000166AB4E|nr:DoxX family protein [Paenibacillus sp. JDR-2]ACT04805.1 conserved hypothetical protein [Paenibacillus sp. JDR-2]
MVVMTIVLQSLLLAYYLFSGTAKVLGAKYWTGIFTHLGLSREFRIITGFVQLIGAAALCAGYWDNGILDLAVIWLAITMLVACFVHLKARDSFGKTAPALVFAILNLIILSANFNDLSSFF